MLLYCNSFEENFGCFGSEDKLNKLKRISMETKSIESYIQIILQKDGGAISEINRTYT